MKRSPLVRRTPLRSSRTPLNCSPALKRTEPNKRRKPVSPASPAQRERVKGKCCIRCGNQPVHPAHLIDRGMGGDDHPHAVVPLCFECHRLYDTGKVSILEHLEPHHRDELAYAVRLVGLICALERVTNERWRPVLEAEPQGGANIPKFGGVA